MLFAFGWLALNAADKRLDAPEQFTPLAHPGPWMAMAVLTRYEAWPITAVLTTITALSRPVDRIRTFIRLALWPATAAIAFLLFGRLTLGKFLADAGFFTPDNPAAHQPLVALQQIFRGYVAIAGWPVVVSTLLAAFMLVGAAVRAKSARPLLPLALVAAALLPFSAFVDGHPYRVRYMIALVAASGALIGAGLGAMPRRVRPWLALGLVAATLWVRPPLDRTAPMIVEAQRESPTRAGRVVVTAYLAAHYEGTPILASMNSLGHYMQELSAIGMNLRDFINAGNGDIWAAAVAHPERHAGWVMIEEAAEGGYEFAAIVRERPDYLKDFDRVASGGGATLYRRQ
jgi:hypothetical protein